MIIQRLFSNKEQKKLRRVRDYQIGQERLEKINPESAEAAFLWGKAAYPGEEVVRAYRDRGGDFHIQTNYRSSVSPEKADLLAELAQKNPKRFQINRGIVAGRDLEHGTTGYSKDLTNLNQRINARALGDSKLGEKEALDELRRRKASGWTSYEQRIKKIAKKVK